MEGPILFLILLRGAVGVAITGDTIGMMDQPIADNSAIERAKQEFTECRLNQNRGPPDERNGWFAC